MNLERLKHFLFLPLNMKRIIKKESIRHCSDQHMTVQRKEYEEESTLQRI